VTEHELVFILLFSFGFPFHPVGLTAVVLVVVFILVGFVGKMLIFSVAAVLVVNVDFQRLVGGITSLTASAETASIAEAKKDLRSMLLDVSDS
jgi:hypothetical protein